ncbi:ribonuclease H2 subunit B [Perilla frutescens var. hirtella]|uniref:Ribonuclease H2 subunit B n=1 Tax=Perilla frutescens var. hirtella TaxID=608512 RepID=A0AAD4IXN2_PERFH|nr:ribonuclease H2 subunit B [Perilla frutescens var. hirtella]
MDIQINQCRPPALDSNGKNYAMWKSRMNMYIKSIDERAWLAVIEEWSPPRMEGPNGVYILTPETQWTNDDRIIFNFNSRALNAIFVSVDVPCFTMVCNCTTAYQAWSILQEHCEGSISVRQTKLRLLTSKFETLRMLENETISMYTERLCEVSNESTALGCPISNENMVSKLLRTLPERFNMKISAIEEAHNVSNMSLSEAVSIVLTFEMNLENQKSNTSSKGIALQSVTSSSKVELDVENIQEITEDEPLSVALLTKKFNTLVRSMKKGSPNFKPRRLFDSPSSTSSGSTKSSKSPDVAVKDIDSVQCRGCSGFAHYANECPTVQRKQRRNYSAAMLSDESGDEEAEKQTVLFVKANDDFDEMIGALTDMESVDYDYDAILDHVTPDVPSNVMENLDEFCNTAEVSQVEEDKSEVSHQEALQQLHKVVDEVCVQWTEQSKEFGILVEENQTLKQRVLDLEIRLTRSDLELNKLRKEVEAPSKIFRQLNQGTSTLNEEKKFVCHYCQEPGHIKPYCFKYHDDIATGIASKSEEDDVIDLIDTDEMSSDQAESDCENKTSTENVKVNVPQNDEALVKTSTPTFTSDSEDDQVVTAEDEPRRDPPSRIRKNHPDSQIIGEQSEGVQTRSKNSEEYKEMLKLQMMELTKGSPSSASTPAAAVQPPLSAISTQTPDIAPPTTQGEPTTANVIEPSTSKAMPTEAEVHPDLIIPPGTEILNPKPIRMNKLKMAWWEGIDETRVLIAQDPSTSGKHLSTILSLRHPRTGNQACYLYIDGVIQEIHWFKQSYGSWFLGDYVCEDGRLYTATPIDPVFILLPIFEEARIKKGNEPGKFRQLDEIMYIHGFPGYQSLSSVAEKAMQVVCDLKEVGSTKFFRLNDLKVLKWLCYKVHQLKHTLLTLDKNYAARDEKDTLFDAVSIVREYLKDEPWLNLLCNKLKLNLEDWAITQDVGTLLPSTGAGLGSFTPVQENNGTEKKASRTTRQVKKVKVEKDSQNIKDMFSRATRKRG